MNKNTSFYMLSLEKTGWYISSYTRKAPVGGNFLELLEISDDDKIFIENNIREGRRELFLLKSGEFSVLLSTHLCFSSGLIFAALIEAPIKFTVSLISRNNLCTVIKCPSCDGADVMKRISKSSIELFEAVSTLLSGISIVPEASAYSLLSLMEERIRIASDLVGCIIESENEGVFGTVKNYDISLATAFFISAAAYVKRAGLTRSGIISFFSAREALYISFEVETVDGARPFELDALRFCADVLEVNLCVLEEKGKTYARLCACRPDPSKIGLKDDIFLT